MQIKFLVNNSSYVNKTQAQTASKLASTSEVSVFENAKNVETEKTAQTNFAAKDKNPEATFDRQTCKTLGISEEEWNAMSEQEKSEKNAIAIKQIVDNHNTWYNTLLGRRTTYANQYRIYAQRSTSPEEIARLTSVVKSLDKKNQLDSIIGKIEYKSTELKNVADKVMANDYVNYIEENQVVAAQKIADSAIEENKVIAAKNSTKADVKQQVGVVNALMSAKNEKVDDTIASQQGQYGIDKDGNKDTNVELGVFKAISTSKFVSALKIAAKNIFKLDNANKEAAVNAIKSTKVKEAIEQISIKNVEDSAENLELLAEESEILTESVDEDYNTTNKEIASALRHNDRVAIEKCFNYMTTEEISQFVSQNSRSDVYNQLLSLNLDYVTLKIIEKNMNRSNVKVSSNSLENNLSNLSSESQIKYLKQIKSEGGSVAGVNRNFLTLTAQKVYDKIA